MGATKEVRLPGCPDGSANSAKRDKKPWKNISNDQISSAEKS